MAAITDVQLETTGAPARVVALERAAALPGSRELIKSLRPLRRRMVLPGAALIDVDATVRRAAEEDLWYPTFASSRERWLDVMLVADHGLSMILWKDTIDELERVLRNSSAFRSVRSWWLESDAREVEINVRGRGIRPKRPESLTRLTHGSGRSVVLIVSDCVGARWQDGDIPRLIDSWSHEMPVALLQVTPEWFWNRTALGDTVGSRLRSTAPGAVNSRFRWDSSALGANALTRAEEKKLLRLPAAALTPEAVARIAGLIAGVGREWTRGVVFDLEWTQDDSHAPPAAASAEDRVTRFRALASKPAQRLAAAFAASPVRTLGVLRLLRRDLIRDATPFAEAEVLLGGVMRVAVTDPAIQWELGASLPLEFVPGVQSLLLDGALASDVLRVLTHAAASAESGAAPTFVSWLEDPASGAAQLDASESAFAAAAAKTLDRLGGAYARIIKPDSLPADAQGLTSPTATERSRQQVVVDHVTGGFRRILGFPHSLSTAPIVVGREIELGRIERWLSEDPESQILAFLGPEGIGKSALAAMALVQWSVLWPDDEPFVWSFREKRSEEEAYEEMRRHFPRAQLPMRISGEVPRDPQLKRSLVVFDGVDALPEQSGFERLLEHATSLAASGQSRVLITSRRGVSDLERTREIELRPLEDRDIDKLIRGGQSVEKRAEPSTEETSALLRLTQRLGGGNPLVIRTLIAASRAVPAIDLIQDLDVEGGDAHSIAPSGLADFDGILKQIKRAHELTAAGRAAINEGQLENALRTFDESVAVRDRLPSRLLSGRALLDRGNVNLMLEDTARAHDDLASAISLFRMVSATSDLIGALEILSSVWMLNADMESAMRATQEALELSRTDSDRRRTIRLLMQVSRIETQRGALLDALAHLGDAIAVALDLGDPRTTGMVYLDLGRAHMRNGDRDLAYSSAVAAFDQLQKSGDNELAAEARRDIETVQPNEAVPAHDALPGDDTVVTEEFIVTGRVQGVGFRTYAQQCMKELGVEEGSASNLLTGGTRVRATAQRRILRRLEDRLRTGPPNSVVERITITEMITTSRTANASEGEASTDAANTPAKRFAFTLDRAVIAIGVENPGDEPPVAGASAAARQFSNWALESQQIASDRVILLVDDETPVTVSRIREAVARVLASEAIDQLIVYFAGYSAGNGQGNWLTSDSARDRNASIDVEGTIQLARYCRVPHVILLSDTARLPVDSVPRQRLAGQPIYPRPTEAPAQFHDPDNPFCGSLVLWTKID